MSLNSEQKKVVDSILSGDNVFITGSAGVGKSFLVKHITELLTKENKTYRILAPTGVAATNIGGMTIHRFLGLIPSIITIEDYVIKRMKNCKEAFNEIDVIFVDEISMVTPSLFKLMDEVIRIHVPKDTRPFSGIQMVLLGDLFQLPYIPDKDNTHPIFESPLWKSMNISIHQLHQVMRQDDPTFISALNDLRLGKFSDNLKKVLRICINNKKDPNLHYVRLFSLNIQRQYANETELAKLTTETRTFKSRDIGELKCLDGCQAVKTLILKVNCPVMLLRNLPEHDLYNGSLGVVTEFNPESGLPIVTFENGVILPIEKTSWEIAQRHKKKTTTIAARVQIPLAVAYSLSVHKSQGLTISHLEVDLNGVFTTGQMYVALSRAKTISGLIVKNFHPKHIQVDERVLKWHENK